MAFGAFLLLILSTSVHTSSLPVYMYCGELNCYDVLGVERDATKNEIAKVYRQLAKLYHPDRVKDMDKVEAEAKFRQIATAYETLKDDETRNDYNYMLDNPDAHYYNYYQYYRRRVTPKVDVRIVIAGTILIISLIQYISAHHKFNEAVGYLMTQPKYRIRAMEIAKERGLLDDDNTKTKGRRKKDKSSVELQEAIVRSIIEENIDIKGGYKKPSIFDLFLFRIIFFPYTIANYVYWCLQWIWRYNICRQEYDKEAKLHIIRKYLNMSLSQFTCLPDGDHDRFLRDELWIRPKFDAWKKEKEAQEQEKLLNSGRYKQYRRYMKNHGPGQISFVDE